MLRDVVQFEGHVLPLPQVLQMGFHGVGNMQLPPSCFTIGLYPQGDNQFWISAKHSQGLKALRAVQMLWLTLINNFSLIMLNLKQIKYSK